MDDRNVMQGYLTRVNDYVDCLCFVHLDCDLLTTRQRVVRLIGVSLRKERVLVRPRNHPHAAIFRNTFRERYPGGCDLWWMKTPVGRILMPGDVFLVSRHLGEPAGIPNQQIGTE